MGIGGIEQILWTKALVITNFRTNHGEVKVFQFYRVIKKRMMYIRLQQLRIARGSEIERGAWARNCSKYGT